MADIVHRYRDGESEMWVGEWMASRKNRDQMIIATKFTNSYRPAQTEELQSNYKGNSLKSMRLSLESSLERLQTDYIDLYYLHVWDYTVSIPELMLGLNDLVRSGKVLYLGISDTPAWIVSKANQYARDHGLRQFSVYQGMWNAAKRDFERDIIPMAIHEGMALCPYATLNQGNFQTRAGYVEREKGHNGRHLIAASDADKKVAGVLEDLAEDRKDGTTLLNIAQAYIMQKAPYVFPIIGSRKVEHIVGAMEAVKVSLSDEDIDMIENAVHFQHGFPTDFLNTSLFNPEAKWIMVANAPDVAFSNTGNDWVEPPKAIRPGKK